MGLVSIEKNEYKNLIRSIIKEEQIKYINKRWLTSTKNEKKFIVEFLKYVYPEKGKLINEATGFNTALDIAGIFDPTGVIDLYNGFDYWKQDDHLFAILSWVSVFPYFGDLIAKPIVGLAKFGGQSFKAFNLAFKAGNAAKMAKIAKDEPKLMKLLTESPAWGEKLLEVLRASVGKIPLVKRVIPLLEDYIKLFKNAGSSAKLGSAVGKTISAAEKESLKTTFRGFREFGGSRWFNFLKVWGSKEFSLYAKFMAGVPRLFGNAATRSLMRRTKWYLGLLDWIGIADTKSSPEDVIKNHPEQFEEYGNSQVGQKNWLSDFGEDPSLVDKVQVTDDGKNKSGDESMDNDDSLKNNLFGMFFKSILS